MSICAEHSMTNLHDSSVWARIAETVRCWRQRHNERLELAKYSERELRDVGLSWGEMIFEAEKPFWRA